MVLMVVVVGGGSEKVHKNADPEPSGRAEDWRKSFINGSANINIYFICDLHYGRHCA